MHPLPPQGLVQLNKEQSCCQIRRNIWLPDIIFAVKLKFLQVLRSYIISLLSLFVRVADPDFLWRNEGINLSSRLRAIWAGGVITLELWLRLHGFYARFIISLFHPIVTTFMLVNSSVQVFYQFGFQCVALEELFAQNNFTVFYHKTKHPLLNATLSALSKITQMSDIAFVTFHFPFCFAPILS